MNKYDWLEVVTRAIGIWLVASGAVAVLNSIGLNTVEIGSALGESMARSTLVVALGTSFIGTAMVLLAPGFIGWLKEKDDAARATHKKGTELS